MSTDQELIGRVVSGDEHAFDVLFERHAAQVQRRLASVVRDDAMAEDLLQEVFMRVWTRADQWQGTGSFAGWVMRIATNIALSHLRSVKRRPAATNALDDREPQALSQWLYEHAAPGPDHVLEQTEQFEEMRRLVETLPERQREAVRMVHEMEMTIEEAAEELGIPPGTVKSRLYYARNALSQEWNDMREDYE